MDKQKILELANEALSCQFEIYSWSEVIDDIGDLSPEEIKWAQRNIGYKAYIIEGDK